MLAEQKGTLLYPHISYPLGEGDMWFGGVGHAGGLLLFVFVCGGGEHNSVGVDADKCGAWRVGFGSDADHIAFPRRLSFHRSTLPLGLDPTLDVEANLLSLCCPVQHHLPYRLHSAE